MSGLHFLSSQPPSQQPALAEAACHLGWPHCRGRAAAQRRQRRSAAPRQSEHCCGIPPQTQAARAAVQVCSHIYSVCQHAQSCITGQLHAHPPTHPPVGKHLFHGALNVGHRADVREDADCRWTGGQQGEEGGRQRAEEWGRLITCTDGRETRTMSRRADAGSRQLGGWAGGPCCLLAAGWAAAGRGVQAGSRTAAVLPRPS